MKGNISRRGLVKGTAWAVPVVLASTAVPALAASHCQPGIVVPIPTNTSTDGSSLTHTFTATDKTQSLTFTITGGAGGSYQGDSYQGFGGAGAYITGTIDLTEGDTVTFITAGGGGPYSGSAEAPGRGWADGGSHEAAYIGTNSYTNAFQEGPGRITELYGPTGGGASAVLLNGTPIAIAGGGGGGGARQISRTTWSKIYGERPSGFKGLRFNHGNIANGGTGGPSYTGGEGYDETYEYFPGPSLHMNGGKGGYNGWAGAGGEAGNLLNPTSNSSLSFKNNSTYYTYRQSLAGNAGDNGYLTTPPGGTGGKGVVGIGMVVTIGSTHTDRNQCSVLHGSTGGGGYGGGGSGSVTTAAGYATDQRWAGEYTYVNGEYQAGDYWSPVGSAAFSGAGGAGGSYLDNQRVYSGYIATGTSPGVAGSRVNGTSFATVCEIQD